MPKLTIHNGSMTTIHDIVGDRISIGRHPDNAVVIPDESVSSHHSEIVAVDNAWLLLDLRSSNGTTVNGENAETKKLGSNDVIMFGAVECVFQLATASKLDRMQNKFLRLRDIGDALHVGLRTVNHGARRTVMQLKHRGLVGLVVASLYILLVVVAMRIAYVAGKHHDHRSSRRVVGSAATNSDATNTRQYPRVESFPTTEEAMREEVRSLNANSAYGYGKTQSSYNGWGSPNSDVRALPHYERN